MTGGLNEMGELSERPERGMLEVFALKTQAIFFLI